MTPPRVRHYFAYGSNLHPLRLGRRTPSCQLMGAAQLSGYQLRFHKRSDADGSAKCNAMVTGDDRHAVMGAVYQMGLEDLAVLDRIEGLGPGGYERVVTSVTLAGDLIEVFFYAAIPSHVDARLRPFTWYRDLVWHGAAWHGFPREYVERIRRVTAVADPDPERSAQHQALIEEMQA